MQPPDTPRKGRGAISNPALRYSATHVERFDDGWDSEPDALPPLETIVRPDPARSIIARNNSPDLPFSQSINPYRGCEHGCVYCMSGETPILMADGRTRPLADVRAGDWIYGTARQGWYRRYVRTRVVAHWSVIRPAFRLTLEGGTTVVTGGDHRFLTERGWKYVRDSDDQRRPHLTTGDALMGMSGSAASVKDIEGQGVESGGRLRVVGIEAAASTMRLYDITTGTKDFIANGVISHNCYARPTHAYLDLSPGLDFETRLFYKENAAELLTRELAHPGYVCQSITIGANTDPYQPVERRLGVTRSLLEVLARTRHPTSIVTKGSLVLRDLDLLAEMAKTRLAAVLVSVTTLDDATKRTLEPRAASPARRLQIVRALADAGVPVGVLVAPVIPLVTDHELEEILARAAEAGARTAGYVLLRMPHEIKDLFEEWLRAHAPLKAGHVMSLMRQMHGGRAYDATFGHRQRGSGPYAELLARRFALACERAGFAPRGTLELDTTQFRPPSLPAPGGQLELW
jgi:DNA repair photolyase